MTKTSDLKNIERDMLGAIRWILSELEQNDTTMNVELLIADVKFLINQARKYETLLERYVDLEQENEMLCKQIEKLSGDVRWN